MMAEEKITEDTLQPHMGVISYVLIHKTVYLLLFFMSSLKTTFSSESSDE